MSENAMQLQTGNRGLVLRSLDDMTRWAEGVKQSGLAPRTLSTSAQISGVFSYQDLETVQDAAEEVLKSGVNVNCLILADKFTGWGKEGDWGNLSFMYESDSYIGKIAVVADERWKDELLMFLGAGRRQAEVRFFLSDEEDEAQSWLAESAD